jgi:hypothetical protein
VSRSADAHDPGSNAELMKVTEPMESGSIDAVVLDVGGVLIDWDPRHLYRKILHDADWMETFLGEVWVFRHECG